MLYYMSGTMGNASAIVGKAAGSLEDDSEKR